jgi:hypothetical protein
VLGRTHCYLRFERCELFVEIRGSSCGGGYFCLRCRHHLLHYRESGLQRLVGAFELVLQHSGFVLRGHTILQDNKSGSIIWHAATLAFELHVALILPSLLAALSFKLAITLILPSLLVALSFKITIGLSVSSLLLH